MDRRRFLSALGVAGGGLLVTWQTQAVAWMNIGQLPLDTRNLRTDSARVFDLSVSSADPSPTGVILWTHIAPDAIRAGESLYLQVGLDANFQTLLLQAQIAPQDINPGRDHTVKIDLDGQLPATLSGGPYFYRFIYDGTVSRTGRCRTLPSASSALKRLKLGLLTCQDFTNGYYGALAHLSRDESIDYVLHLGDFIYETAGDPRFQSLPFSDRTMVLPSGGTVALDLDDYRFIYRTIRRDPNLQAAMERHTFICVPDDHETANDTYWDYARDTLGAPDHPYTTDPKYGNSPALLKQLKLDSQRAWTEYVPARVSFNPLATHPFEALKVYRNFQFGSFLDLFMIENRTYRSAHACGEGDIGQRYFPLGCTQYASTEQTLLGAKQHNWLVEGLTQSRATWKLMGNQTFFGRLAVTFLGTQLAPLNVDAWDGFQAERRALTGALRDAKVRNFLVATGDLHTYMTSNIKHDYGNLNPLDFDNYVGAEFMTPSVTSSNLAEMLSAKADETTKVLIGRALAEPAVRLNNPHIQFFDSSRQGYSTLELTDSYTEWVAYAVDKSISDGSAVRKCIARQRKYMSLPWLMAQSTSGY
ncbi:MAG: alkaline phosphatase D family protein [Proteobacteria bacterium]|uniref:alkaline phosphatase D family protein n=1 Tax=Aquabacterium sp. TaxID=1872578 RepID=UPI0035C6E36D|nr:alkaline phosphatase D family protein [Pseudomonadota bacterium]